MLYVQMVFHLNIFVPAILDGLKDFDPYVKKTAIMACIKLFYAEPETVLRGNIIEILY